MKNLWSFIRKSNISEFTIQFFMRQFLFPYLNLPDCQIVYLIGKVGGEVAGAGVIEVTSQSHISMTEEDHKR